MKALTWRSVSGGIAALIGIVLIVFVVLKYARTGALHGDKFRLYVAVPDASNILTGTEVWLNGQRVGTVVRIEFAPPSAALDERVVIVTDVLVRFRDQIRLDSHARLQSGGTIIGAPVVYLTSGTPARRVVAPGDTVRGLGKSDFEIAASRVTEAAEELPAIAADTKVIMADAQATSARLRGIAQESGRSPFGARASQLMRRLRSGDGSASRAMRDQDVRRSVSRAMAAADSLRILLSSRLSEVGRFRRDSTLGLTVQALRDDVAELRTLATNPNGSVGRVTKDSALTQSLDSLFVELNSLITDIKKNPLRYARVF
jgi:phospholipid/cholesterol/gamma-HCH transport system substrate-binding protein